jgi:hypothetical protein
MTRPPRRPETPPPARPSRPGDDHKASTVPSGTPKTRASALPTMTTVTAPRTGDVDERHRRRGDRRNRYRHDGDEDGVERHEDARCRGRHAEPAADLGQQADGQQLCADREERARRERCSRPLRHPSIIPDRMCLAPRLLWFRVDVVGTRRRGGSAHRSGNCRDRKGNEAAETLPRAVVAAPRPFLATASGPAQRGREPRRIRGRALRRRPTRDR